MRREPDVRMRWLMQATSSPLYRTSLPVPTHEVIRPCVLCNGTAVFDLRIRLLHYTLHMQHDTKSRALLGAWTSLAGRRTMSFNARAQDNTRWLAHHAERLP